MHLASREHNFWGGYAIVAGHLPLAAGIALKVKYNNEDNVVLCFMGDGATNNGYFHESLNLSAVWDLPVVWLIENNGYGMGPPVAAASGQPELHKRAIAYGMKDFERVDGQNVVEVYNRVSEAVAYARQHGPELMEAMTYRYLGHGVSDRSYSERHDELMAWHEKDPITILHSIIADHYKEAAPALKQIEAEADQQVAEAIEFAEGSPMPGYEDLMSNVYVEEKHG